ncbi:hypothetical protein MARA_00210 (plasmid) [Mycolicibacterium arabiense]|uniref:Uncharacterized protein n=1 Tax=Mycolicibacterium arabiense TaxID=1286181 RepID=A0A7I7RQU6_9MYCO|nr:hypothetical protein [Mycolicibacterium arabiense]MCV7372079.1 hypothetical protein [Mycolicibacterium arabiense]BBY46591.1 hypothetical protein MARA_00210 [Mycolicibacterium arabiense]
MPAEVFDEERRAWIAAHAGIWMFQKRRAELLGKRIRARSRARVGARPDPHDDQVTAPLVFRTSSTTTGALETGVVAAIAAAAPIGWPVGRVFYAVIVGLIPERLQSYPIAALTWAAVLSGAPLPLLYDPTPSLMSTLLVPWLLAQVPATFAAAAAYGVLEGWLAIDGSSDWWPMTPAQRDIDDTLILGPTPVSMPTLLDPSPPTSNRPADAPRVPRRRPAPVKSVRLAIPAAIAAIGTMWFIAAVGGAIMTYPADLLSH